MRCFMSGSLRTGLLVRWFCGLAILVALAPSILAELGPPSPVAVTISRDSHAVIDFWANLNWSTRSFGGVVAEMDQVERKIGGVRLSLWRLEGAESLTGSEREHIRRLGLNEFQDFVRQSGGRLKLREFGHTNTSTAGEFRFDRLPAGLYSLQFDWKSLGERSVVEVYERRPSIMHASLAAFLQTEGYRPPGQ